MEPDAQDEFKSRPYQIDLYEQALKQNCIIFLPTGAGKTFIAVKLIKQLSGSTLTPFSKGGKRTIFLVNTVPLVTQQCTYIARHTGLSCNGYSGDMKVDFWSNLQWETDFENTQVLVMTTHILLALLTHGILSLRKINLLIFDECHRAVSDHPMRQVMQLFQVCPKAEQPRVLALSATLLNANIKLTSIESTLKMLETTFHAKIATVNECAGVQKFSANPREMIVRYKQYQISPVCAIIQKYLNNAKAILEIAAMREPTDESSKVFQRKPTSKKLKNLLTSMEEQLLDMGLYGVNIAAILLCIQLEGFKKFNKCHATGYVLEYFTTIMINIRKICHDEMDGHSEEDKIFKFSSDHICQLIALLKRVNEYNQDEKFCGIIFVQRRLSVQILYHILKKLNAASNEYKFLLPTYVLGFSNNPYKTAREILCTSKWNNEALRSFRSGLFNCIVATDVLDEGVDIPTCTLVVRYNIPIDFRAYVQSKGRARHSSSYFALLVAETDGRYEKRHKLYIQTQLQLQRLLIGQSNTRIVAADEDIQKELYEHKIESYSVTAKDGVISVVTEQMSISLINQYCMNLYKSMFVKLAPTWILHTVFSPGKNYYKVSVKLPIVSRCKEEIFGNFMPSIRLAKRSVAMEVCKKLHKLGELTDRLLPVEQHIISQDVNYLFGNWIEEDAQENNILGTYKKKRQHKIQYPESLYGAFPEPAKPLYLHIIKTKPTYSVPHDNRHLTFYNLLHDSAGYAILTTKPMPALPTFFVFMNVGELNVTVLTNHKVITMKSDDIQQLRIFHSLIFNQIIPLIKSFMVFDNENLDNCFLVVPVNNEWDIDWDIVGKYQCIERCKPSDPFQVKITDYEMALVEPSYRSSASVYIVTQVCDDISPSSCFPTDDFDSYTHYYRDKHSLRICNLKQPMLEVKAISTSINCIRPRSMKPGMSKRKRANVLEDFDEHLVPELCVRVIFPALYWLKATTLPSILHRISQLLVAEDFRTTVVKEANLGMLSGSSRNSWSLLEVSEREAYESSEPLLEATYDESADTSQPEPELNDSEIVDVLDLDTKIYPWSKEHEPIDLYRNLSRIKTIDIEYYHQFMSASCEESEELLKHKCKQIEYISSPDILVPNLKVLAAADKNGPTSVEIMQALTSKLAHDIFDFERLETLGDSFLKFIVSLYLYQSFRILNEGQLTAIKGKLIGNRNLYYCGNAKGIPGSIKVDDFLPKSNFIVPAYSAFRNLQRRLIERNISPNVLYEIRIPTEEQFSGYISKSTQALMEEKILEWDIAEFPTGMEHFLGLQTVPDKVVADCVEALIGVYLKNMGPKGASTFLQWLQVLPNNIDIEKLLSEDPQNCTNPATNLNQHLQSADYIESRLKYKFRNRAYLLQALTHPSYLYNTVTESYQRLEFLGDAVLDFLITSHIYETCTNLSPGALTDLRSALVNNVTLACLTVRYGFHTGLLAMSPELTDVIDKFLRFQEGRDHAVDDELLWVLLEEDECNISEYVEVPKILGDLFESLIGAVYLDSKRNLSKTWEVIYTLMQKEIDMFSKNVPKQPVRVLYETQGAHPIFMTATAIDRTNAVVVPLEVTIAGKQKLFHGFGANKKQAKRAAAKQALKFIRCKT